MSAPEVRISPTGTDHLHDSCSWVCSECGDAGWSPSRADAERRAVEHEVTCAAIQLAHLQARWEARTEALSALITEWETTDGMPDPDDVDPERVR